MKFHLNLSSSSGKSGSFPFVVRSHRAAIHWFECLKKASQHSEIADGRRWYHFHNHEYGSFESLSRKLNETIKELKLLEPSLSFERVDLNNIQTSVNRLHIQFADSHLVENRINQKSWSVWNEFNNLLHAFETLERSEEVEKERGMRNRSIIFTWKNNFCEPLADKEYNEFTVGKQFGTMYVNYCQVGRHILEMYLAQDDVAEDEHILPLRYVSADSYLWLGPTSGKSGIEKKMSGIEAWFKNNQARLNSLGFHWGDPQLAIGWIPVADLSLLSEGDANKDSIIRKFEEFDEVVSVSIVEDTLK